MNRRVVVTGLSVASPLGCDLGAFWDAVLGGRSGIRRISYYDASAYPTQIAGEVRDFDASAYPELDKPRRYARAARFALVCARKALDDAGLTRRSPGIADGGVFVGTGQGGDQSPRSPIEPSTPRAGGRSRPSRCPRRWPTSSPITSPSSAAFTALTSPSPAEAAGRAFDGANAVLVLRPHA